MVQQVWNTLLNNEVSSSPHRYPKVTLQASAMRVLVRWMRRHLACICHLLLVALVLGLGALTGYTGLLAGFNTTYCQDSVLEQLLVGKAIVDGPMKANSTSLKGARIYRQSEVLIQGYLEVCNQQRTYKAWAAFHVHQVTLKVVTPLIPLQAWGRNFLAQVQTLESGRLVLSLAIIATLAAFMFINVIKHKRYFYEQQPHSRGEASAEGVTGAIPKRLTLLQLLQVTDTDDLDAMVVLVLVGVHLVWRMASGLSTCLAMTCQACAFIAAAVCQTARAIKMTAALQLITAERDGLAAKLQAANYCRTTTDDYLHELLSKSENRALEAEGQTRHYSQRVRALEWQKFQDKKSDGGLAQKYDSLTALLSRTRQEKRQVEDRLHGVFTHVSSLEEKAARAKQSHAAELSDVITNLELSKKDLVHSEQARVAAANNSASLSTTLQSLKSFCDSQTHKLSESCASLHISDHLCNSLEQRLEGVTAQCDRLANQVDSLRDGKFDQNREVRAVEFKCVNLRQQLAEALSGKTELTLYATQLTAEKLNVSEQLLQVRAQNTQLASELTVALTEKADDKKQLQQLQAGSDDLSAQLAAALSGKAAAEQHAQQLQAGHADLSLQLSKAVAGRTEAAVHVQELQAGSDHLSAQLVDALTSGSAAQKQLHQLQTSDTTLAEELAAATQKLQQQKAVSTSLHAELALLAAGKQDSERQLVLLNSQKEELQHQLMAAAKEAAQHATRIGCGFVANERLQVQLTAESQQKQQLADKVAGLEADVSRLKGQSVKELAGLQSCLDASLEHLRLSRAELEAKSAETHARCEREAEQHAEVVQQLQQQRDREARAHSKEVTRLRDLLEVAHPANSHTLKAAAAMPVTQPNNPAANTPTFKLAPGGAGKAVPAFPSPSANSVVGRGKATPADPYILEKGALSAAQASAANPPAAGSSQAGAVVPNKQANNMAANIPPPKPSPVGADQALPAFPSPSAKCIESGGKGAPSAAQASPANPPAAGSSQAVLPALQKSPAQDKADLSKPGNPKHGAHRQVVAGPKSGSTPLQDQSNGSKPARFSGASPLKDCPKSDHSADRKAVSGGVAAMRLAGAKLDQPAAELQSSGSKESKSLTSNAVAKSNSHSSSRTGMQAFSKGMSPHGLVKGRAACKVSHHPSSRRAADASSRSVSSPGAVGAQSTTQTQPSHFAFSPFRSVKGQQAEGQQKQSKAATATTWRNPVFACSTAPPSFCGSAIAPSLVPDHHAKPEGHRQTGPLPSEPARQPLSTAAAEPNKSSPALDDLIRQMKLLSIAGPCSSSSSDQESVLPAVADPAVALQRSADAAQASSAPAWSLSSSDLKAPSQSIPDATSADQAPLLVAEPLSAEDPAACSAETGSVSALLGPSGNYQDNANVTFGSSTSDCEQPDLAGAAVQMAQAGVTGTKQAQGSSATASTGESRAAAAVTGQTPFVSPTKKHHHSLAAAAAGLVTSGPAGSPMMALPSAASEASDTSLAELYAMLDAGLLDSPSPSAGSFSSIVHRREVSPVPFGSLSSTIDANEDANQASAAAALISFRQAAVHTESVPDFDNAHGVLADQLWGDHPANSHTPEAAAAMPVKHPAATIPAPKLAPVGAGKAVPAVPSSSANSVVGRGKATPADPYILVKGAPSAAKASATPPAAGSSQAGAVMPNKQPKNMAANIPNPKPPPVGAVKALPAFPPSAKGVVSSGKGALSAAQASPANPSAAGSSQAGAVVPNKQPNNMAANIPTPKVPPVGADKALPAFPSPSAKCIESIGKGAPSAAQASPANPPAAGSSQAVLPALQKSPAQDKADLSKPGNPKHGAHRQVMAGPKSGSTPLQDLSNGSKPARFSGASPLRDCPKSDHSADRKAVSGDTAAMRLAGSKLDQPAAELQSSDSKESKSLTSNAVAKSNSHSSSRTGMQAFSKGMSPHGLVKGRVACKVSRHPKSRRAADASSRSVSSTGAVTAQSTTQTQPSHFAFSPFRSVKGQQAEGQQDKSKAAPQVAATATTWSNPMFAYSTAPPSFCGSAIAPSLVPDDHAKPEAQGQTGPLPLEPARQPSNAAAAEPNKSSPALDDLIRQMQMLSIAGSCFSSSSELESVLPAVTDPADALQRSADAAQASSAPARSLSSSDSNMPSKSTPDASSVGQATLLVAEPLSAEDPAACSAETGSVSALLGPSGNYQDNANVLFGSSTSDCQQPDLAGAAVQMAQAGVTGTKQAQGAAATAHTGEPQDAAAAAVTGLISVVSATKEHHHSPAAAAAVLVMSGPAGRPMMASPSAASEASDASLAELCAMLEAGLQDSPSPAVGSFGSVDPAVHRREVSPVPFGSLSSTIDANEDANQASAAAAMDSFRQAAVQTEGIPDFDNAHSVLADQLWDDVMSLDDLLVGFNDLLTPSSPQTWDASAASQEAVLQAGLLPGMEALSVDTHQHRGSQAAEEPSPVVSGQASCEPAFTGAHDVGLLAGGSSILDLRGSKPGVLSHMTDQEIEAILLADSP
ncbi:TPA: hypothetical protein ACH3X2_002104 [Trebouxia sp. C0005]